MSDESLITAVSECPVLYDLTLKAYHDQTKRNQAWRDISAMLGVTDNGAGNSGMNIFANVTGTPDEPSTCARAIARVTAQAVNTSGNSSKHLSDSTDSSTPVGLLTTGVDGD
ncbi:unnamed protein product [Arctogadus glacialis]